ncbi:hypothetical protein FMN50_00450 [Rhodobacterales bacterium]|nr:hypothetical protein FMN50_00450 [Rhodobacterales bacterium]
MEDYFGEFNDKSGAAEEVRQRLDFEDAQREAAGIEIGRIPRFLSSDAREAIAERSGNRASRSSLSALDILLLNDPEYAQIHQAALDENRAAQAAVTDLQDRIAQVMGKLDTKIEETLDQAVTLPDGRKAFMNENGEVYTADGELVDPAITEGYDWESRPTHETYLSLTQDRARLDELRNESQRHSLRLGEILDALEDEDDPATKDEIHSLRREQDGISERAQELDGEVSHIENNFGGATIDARPDQTQTISSIPKAEDLTF